MAASIFLRLDALGAEALDRRVRWHRMPLPLELLAVVGLRIRLRQRNLYDSSPATSKHRPASPDVGRHLTERTADGTFNDPRNSLMGSAGTRFGRNVPLGRTYPDNDWALLEPNPRTVGRELLTRDEFKPAKTLNLLAAAWLQFMIRDRLSHGKCEKENPLDGRPRERSGG